MCNSGVCPHERWSGECGKKRGDVCPEMYEDDESYEAARIAAFEDQELKWEHQKIKWEAKPCLK